MKLSIVATLYQSAPYIGEFHQRVTTVAKQFAGDDYEIVLVNDGSPDNSLELAIRLTEADSHVTVVDLSRNFGHHKAIMVGLGNVIGDYVFLIDGDLEEPPEVLSEFGDVILDAPIDLVYGVQIKRKGQLFEKISGSLFYAILNYMSDIKIESNQLVARLMTRRYVDELLRFNEKEIFLAGLYKLVGFESKVVKVEKGFKGETSYTLSKKYLQAINAITSLTSYPLLMLFNFGLAASLGAILLSSYFIVRYFFLGISVAGWLSIIVAVLFFSGLIISSIGIVGLYVSKIFTEVKGRPYDIIRKIYR
jgi:putative glycosyltransferase